MTKLGNFRTIEREKSASCLCIDHSIELSTLLESPENFGEQTDVSGLSSQNFWRWGLSIRIFNMLSRWVQCAAGWKQGNEACCEGNYWRLSFTRVSLNCSGELKQIQVHSFKSECSKYVLYGTSLTSHITIHFFPTEDSVHWSGSKLFRKDRTRKDKIRPLEMVTIFMSDSLQHFGL